MNIDSDVEIISIVEARNDDKIVSNIEFIHTKPGIKSRINIKAVVFDQAKVNIEALLRINKNANQTDTYLKMDCIVMSPNANVKMVPSLEILANDVKGGHGATIGYIDEELLNYLKSKGLDKSLAENTIIKAFLQK
jgi:Fe-S cluster assembly protein SufD